MEMGDPIISEAGDKQQNSLDGATVELEEYSPMGVDIAKKTLVGKFITGKLINRGAVKVIIPKAWGESEDLEVSDLGPNLFIFTFKDWKAARRVLKRSPRFVMGHLLNLQYWIPEVAMYDIDFSFVPLWV